MTKLSLAQECNVGITFKKPTNVIHHITKVNKKNHMIILLDTGKTFDKL